MSSSSLTPEQLQALLQYAGKRLGTTPEALAKTLREGGLEGLQARLPESDSQKLSALLRDRQEAEKFLSAPEIQELLRRLSNP